MLSKHKQNDNNKQNEMRKIQTEGKKIEHQMLKISNINANIEFFCVLFIIYFCYCRNIWHQK